MKCKIFVFLCLMSLFCSGCYEDKGNYDYNDLLRVTIMGFLSEKDGAETEITSITVTAGQTIKVRPVLSFENENTKMNLTHTWLFKDKVIGNEEKLNFTATEVISGYVVLDIEDLDTGNHFRANFSLKILDPYAASGFLVLSERGGESCLSFLEGTYFENKTGFNPYIGLYQKENDKILPRDVFKIHEHFRKNSHSTQIMAVCKNDLIDINAYTFKEENRAAEMFMSGVPTISDVMFMQWVDLVADEQGRLYKRVKSTNELFHSNRFLPSFVENEDGEVLQGIRFIPGDISNSKNLCLLYDTYKKRYLIISDWKNSFGNTLGKVVVAKHGSGDKGWSEGFTRLDHMEGYNVIYTGCYLYPREYLNPAANRYFSIIEKDGVYYHQHFRVNRDYSTGNMNVTEDKQGVMSGLGSIIQENNIFCIMRYAQGFDSSIHPYLLISSGKSLYLYDITVSSAGSTSEEILKLYEFDSPIVAMNGECISGTQLGVGLEDGSFHVLNMTLAKDHLMDKEKLLFWSLPAGQLGTIKDIQYNVQEQSPTFN